MMNVLVFINDIYLFFLDVFPILRDFFFRFILVLYFGDLTYFPLFSLDDLDIRPCALQLAI